MEHGVQHPFLLTKSHNLRTIEGAASLIGSKSDSTEEMLINEGDQPTSNGTSSVRAQAEFREKVMLILQDMAKSCDRWVIKAYDSFGVHFIASLCSRNHLTLTLDDHQGNALTLKLQSGQRNSMVAQSFGEASSLTATRVGL